MAYFTDIFIRRKVVSLVLALSVLIFGLISYFYLPSRQFPVVNIPEITITTKLPGAAPNVTADYITTPIEAAIRDVDGIDYVQGHSVYGESEVTVWLNEGYPADKALTEIQPRINSLLWRLPPGTFNPSIIKNNKQTPVVFFNIGSDQLDENAITDYVTHVLVPQLESIPGVQDVLIHAPREYAMKIWLDPNKLYHHNLTALDVEKAIKENNIQVGTGKLRGTMEEYNIKTNSSLDTPEQFDNLVIKRDGNHLVRLSDVGYAKLGSVDDNFVTLAKGRKYGLIIGPIAAEDASDIEVAKRVLAKMPELIKKFPPHLHSSIVWETYKFSEHSVALVYEAVWEAVLCVIAVIFLFLGSFRALIIPIVTIPLSLIGACLFMALLGFSINSLTLLAFVLAIGLVVDDAIVVLENIHRHMHYATSKLQATLEATREIALPVISMTLVVMIVFLPIGFTSGLTGALFREFAFTLAITVFLSGFFALTLSPMMCEHLLKSGSSENRLEKYINEACNKLASSYRILLNFLLRHRFYVLAFAALIFVACYALLTHTPSQLLPDEEQGAIVVIAKGPTAGSVFYSEKYAQKIIDIFKSYKEAASYLAISGWEGDINKIVAILILRPQQPGDRTEDEVINSINKPLSLLSGMKIFAMNRPILTDVTGLEQPIQFVLQTSGSYYDLDVAMKKLLTITRNNPNFNAVQTDLMIDKPQINVDINRDRAGLLGIPIVKINDVIRMLMGRPILGWFSMNDQSYPVIPEIIRGERVSSTSLKNLYVRNDANELVPLTNLVDIKRVVAPQSLNQFQLLNSGILTANISPHYSMGDAVHFLEESAKKVMTKEMKYDFAGETRQFVIAQGKMLIIFMLSVLAIYIMLAIQFNSFLDPLIVMLSVPLSVTGALLIMRWGDISLNIYTQIGLVMLMGLISKHGILIVNFANYLHDVEKKPLHEAILQAASTRLRPVLMTSAAMVVGAIPLALATGNGSIGISQIGLVIIGGLTFGSLLTLFVVPVIYTFVPRHTEALNLTE
ncbi:MAG: efflux RND transporter permease subunit [Legionellales bacterium]|nr:efflux RND transporter permease subunit [Legionellales bacterium]